MKDRICASCGHVGKPVPQCLGSFLLDVLVWGTVGAAALATAILPLLLVPLAWTIYHVARFNTTKCPACGDLEMVALDSRRGRAVAARLDAVTVWKAEKPENDGLNEAA
jgi:hypothetical protein